MKIRSPFVALAIAVTLQLTAGAAHAATPSKATQVTAPFATHSAATGEAIVLEDRLVFTRGADLYATTIGARTEATFLAKINTQLGSNLTPFLMGQVGSVAVLDSVSGVWRTDGTPEGTYRLVTPDAPAGNINARNFQTIDGVSYFIADPNKVATVYQTDGTVEGTKEFFLGSKMLSRPLVLDSYAGVATPGGPRTVITDGTQARTATLGATMRLNTGAWMKGKYYYPNANQLWKSDGTQAGTVQVKGVKLRVGTVVKATSNRIYFDAPVTLTKKYKAGGVPFVSDGTAKGTHRVTEAKRTSKSYKLDSINDVVVNNTMYECVRAYEVRARTSAPAISTWRWAKISTKGRATVSKIACENQLSVAKGGTVLYVMPADSSWSKYKLMSMNVKTAFK